MNHGTAVDKSQVLKIPLRGILATDGMQLPIQAIVTPSQPILCLPLKHPQKVIFGYGGFLWQRWKPPAEIEVKRTTPQVISHYGLSM